MKTLETVFKTTVYEENDPFALSDLVNREVEYKRHNFRDFDLKSVSVTQSNYKWYATVAFSYSKWFDHPSTDEENEGGKVVQ